MFKWKKLVTINLTAYLDTTWIDTGVSFGVRAPRFMPDCVIVTGTKFEVESEAVKRAIALHEFGHWLVHYSLMNAPSMSWYRRLPVSHPSRDEVIRMRCVSEVLAWRVALSFVECTDAVWQRMAEGLGSYYVWTPKIQALVKKPLKVSGRSIVQAFRLLHKNWMNYKEEED